MAENLVYVDKELKDLIPNFFQNRRDEIADIRNALAEHDLETVEKIGHNIKGVGGGYGFDYVTELGANIEKAASEGDTLLLDQIVKELEEYLENVEIIYQ